MRSWSQRRNAMTGAPVRSAPKEGNAWTCQPSRKSADASSFEAMTAPWPPRPWKRVEIMSASIRQRVRQVLVNGARRAPAGAHRGDHGRSAGDDVPAGKDALLLRGTGLRVGGD